MRRCPTEHGTHGCERIVGDLAGPDEIPERDEQLGVGGTSGRRPQLAPETGAVRRQMGPHRVVQDALGRVPVLPRRGEQGQLVGETQPHATVASAQTAGADPHQLAGGAQFVEHRAAVTADPRREHIGLDRRGHEGGPGQDPERLDERLHSTTLGRDVVPGGQEAGERPLFDRFDLAPQRCQRSAAQLPQHVDVAVLARHAVGAELAEHDTAFGLERGDRTADPFGGRTEAAGDVGHDERAVRAGVPADQFLQRSRRPAR